MGSMRKARREVSRVGPDGCRLGRGGRVAMGWTHRTARAALVVQSAGCEAWCPRRENPPGALFGAPARGGTTYVPSRHANGARPLRSPLGREPTLRRIHPPPLPRLLALARSRREAPPA